MQPLSDICVASCPVSFDAANLPVTVCAPAGLRGVRSGGDARRLLHLVWRHAGSLLSQHQLINAVLHIIAGAVACTKKFHVRRRQSLYSIEARQDAAAKAGKALLFERHIALRIASRRCCDTTFSCRRGSCSCICCMRSGVMKPGSSLGFLFTLLRSS